MPERSVADQTAARLMSGGPLEHAFSDLEAESHNAVGEWNMQAVMAKEENNAGCTINSFVAFFYLNQAIKFIADTAKQCEGKLSPGTEESRECGANILGIMQAFWNAGAYLAALASQCAQTVNSQAECAGVIMGFVGTMTEFFQGVTDSVGSCGMLAAGTHGGHEGAEKGAEGAGGVDPGWCYIDVGSAVPFLAQAGWLVDEAVKDCTVQETEAQKRECAASATAIIAAFSNVVSFISHAASECAATLNLPALCTRDMSSLLSGLAGLTSHSLDLQGTCGLKEPLVAGEFADGLSEAQERRLSQGPMSEVKPPTPSGDPSSQTGFV